jgi:hypothetical protein
MSAEQNQIPWDEPSFESREESAYYNHLERAASFRAGVFQTMHQYGAFFESETGWQGWLHYDLNDDGETGGLAIQGESTEVLVHAYLPDKPGGEEIEGFRIPEIRILTNELFAYSVDDVKEEAYLVQDFTLESDGSAWQYIDDMHLVKGGARETLATLFLSGAKS